MKIDIDYGKLFFYMGKEAFTAFSDTCREQRLSCQDGLTLLVLKGAESLKREDPDSEDTLSSEDYIREQVDAVSELVYMLEERVNELRIALKKKD